MEDICGDMASAPKVRLTTKKLLKGHINKVNSVHFSGDSRFVLATATAHHAYVQDT
jgi:guanine nucleotide-binding protein subunit beta